MSLAPLTQESDSVTVTVHRSAPEGIVDLTVVLTSTEKGWEIHTALDETGERVELNSHETLMATCLANAGVDESGR